MAAPNLLAPLTITGKTVAQGVTSSEADLLVNASASGKALKINTITAVNNAGSAATLTVLLYSAASGGTSTLICKAESLDASERLVVMNKDAAFWLEENRRLVVVSDTTAAIQVICSYEEVE